MPPSSTAHEVELTSIPLANLRASANTEEARAVVATLADRYPRKSSTGIRKYGRIKTRAAYEAAVAAFLAELFLVFANEDREQWLSCSLDKNQFKGQRVSFRMFDDVRKVWRGARLIYEKKHRPGRPDSHSSEPSHLKLTRFRATPKLIRLGAEHGVTPAQVRSHFNFE